MTLEACYNQMNGDYRDVLSRIQLEKLIEKFMLKYPDDLTMDTLTKAVEAGDIEASFKAAHTLKGVAGNLGFTALAKISSELTEQLRPLQEKADEDLYRKTLEAHELVVRTIKQYIAEKEA